jgi:hypothetical protein
VAGQHDPLPLRLRDEAAQVGLCLSNSDELHRISPVVLRPLRLTWRTMTRRSSSRTS